MAAPTLSARDRKGFAEAVAQFRNVLLLIDDPDMQGRLADLRVLVTGFLDLSVAATAPPPPPPPPTPTAAPPPVVDATTTPAQNVPATPPSPAAAPDVNKVFNADDAGVAAPVAIKQQLPRLLTQMGSTARSRGLLEVVIDEQGRVISATVRMPIQPAFDQSLLVAARDWSYKPAMLNGQPVKFRKMIQVVTR